MQIQVEIDEKQVLRQFMRSIDVLALMYLVREVVEEDAVPEGASDATKESNRCYAAASLLEEVIDTLEKV